MLFARNGFLDVLSTSEHMLAECLKSDDLQMMFTISRDLGFVFKFTIIITVVCESMLLKQVKAYAIQSESITHRGQHVC